MSIDMISNVKTHRRADDVSHYVTEIKMLGGQRGLYDLADEAAKEEANDCGEYQVGVAPKPDSSGILFNVKDEVEHARGDAKASEV